MDYKTYITKILTIAVRENASDIHLTAGRQPSIRVGGVLLPLVNEQALSAEDTLAIAKEMIGDKRVSALDEHVEVDFAYSATAKEAVGARFRGNAYFQRGTVSIALRYIPAQIPGFDTLNLPEILKEFCYRPQGFFLVVGPVGQGKSTTLAALIEFINTDRAEHIVTIEDPIEYLFESKHSIVDQREVGFDTKDFPDALQSLFRQDINVAMVGEMRSPTTIATTVTAAETGHLIFSTLHTNNAAQTIDRIIDSFPGDQQNQIKLQLASTLLGVFSQRLLPRVSGGLIPAYELLINNNAVANLIREGRTNEINVVIETGAQDGMIDLNHSLISLVQQGEITIETARAHATDLRALERLL
ncbi:MAG: PilT/PilU family type 4a pilus ATPase [bacterium]|nr:PilT/PilU family type 4a pilus ATPase [bacterium]